MDTVWMKLTVIGRGEVKSKQYFMFGPGGIISFNTVDGNTTIVDSNENMFTIEENDLYIIGVLQKVRNTEGVLDEQDAEESEEEESKGSVPHIQAKSSL